MFRTVPLSIIRCFSLYTQQWYMSCSFADSLRAGSGRKSILILLYDLYHILLLCVQWKTPDDGQRNCPRRVEFYSKNKFENLVHIVAFTVRLNKAKAVPLQAWSGPQGFRMLRFPDFVTTAQDGGKVVSLTHRLHLPPENDPGTHFCQMLCRSQGHSAIGRILCQWKIPMTPALIEPTTFRFVVQRLNHCATAVSVNIADPSYL